MWVAFDSVTLAGIHSDCHFPQLNRLFARYGSPSQLSSNMTEYKAFAAHFESHFAPEIFKAYLKQVELFIGGQAWLSRRCVKLTIDFLDEWFVPFS